MANIVFNIAKGRVVELFNRVDTNDPANSAIIDRARGWRGKPAETT